MNEYVVDNHRTIPHENMNKDNKNSKAVDFRSNEVERVGISQKEGRISDTIKYVIRDIPTKPRFIRTGTINGRTNKETKKSTTSTTD